RGEERDFAFSEISDSERAVYSAQHSTTNGGVCAMLSQMTVRNKSLSLAIVAFFILLLLHRLRQVTCKRCTRFASIVLRPRSELFWNHILLVQPLEQSIWPSKSCPTRCL